MNSTLTRSSVANLSSSIQFLCHGMIEHIDLPAMVTTDFGEVVAVNEALLGYMGGEHGIGHHVYDEATSSKVEGLSQWGKVLASDDGEQGGYVDANLKNFRRAERFDLTFEDQSYFLIKLVTATPMGLTALEQYQQMFMEHCSAMLVVNASTLTIMDANEAAANLYVTTRDALLRHSLAELEVSHTSRPDYDGYGLHTHAINGELRIVETYGSRLDLHGVETLFLTVHDVTERERAHKMLTTQERLLSAGEAICRIGCWEWDLQNNEFAWTQPMYEILGVEKIMHFEEWLEFVDERDKLRVELFFECLSDYEEVRQWKQKKCGVDDESFQIEYRYQRPGGKLVHLEVRLEVVVHEDDECVLAFRGSLQDITEMREREEEISHYANKLERVNRNLEEFTSMASHDLREPARKVVAFGERLMRQQKEHLDDRGKTYLDRMIKAGQRMDGMINSLLELSSCSMEACRKEGRVDLFDLLEDVSSILEVRIEEADAELDFTLARGLIQGDYDQLTHVFQNLIGNAIKFGKYNEPPRIDVFAEASGADMLRITVRDEGIGMSPEYMDEIFKPFRRLHGKCSRYKGNGIGLSICKKIVEAHGGTIHVESALDEGSSFILELPTYSSPSA